MKYLILTVLCAAAMLAPGCSTTRPSDSVTLQGTWKGHEIGREGTCSMMVTGQALEFRGADTNEWYKGTFTLRDDTTPKQLIGSITACPAPEYTGKTVHAIYQIDGGTLTLTGNEPGNPEVPATFDAHGTRKFVLKKI